METRWRGGTDWGSLALDGSIVYDMISGFATHEEGTKVGGDIYFAEKSLPAFLEAKGDLFEEDMDQGLTFGADIKLLAGHDVWNTDIADLGMSVEMQWPSPSSARRWLAEYDEVDDRTQETLNKFDLVLKLTEGMDDKQEVWIEESMSAEVDPCTTCGQISTSVGLHMTGCGDSMDDAVVGTDDDSESTMRDLVPTIEILGIDIDSNNSEVDEMFEAMSDAVTAAMDLIEDSQCHSYSYSYAYNDDGTSSNQTETSSIADDIYSYSYSHIFICR